MNTRCTKCKIVKPLTEFAVFKSQHGTPRFHSWCKGCRRDHANAKKAEKRKAALDAFK